jgi:hypothetical protein
LLKLEDKRKKLFPTITIKQANNNRVENFLIFRIINAVKRVSDKIK